MSRFIAFFAILCAVLSLPAQTPDTATIHGQIVDPSHAAVAGVQVAVKNTDVGLERTAETDSYGNFSLPGLPINGKYEITANKVGFAEGRLSDVTLAGGTTAEVNLQLNVAAGQTQVTVTGVVGEVRTDQPQLGVHLSESQMEETPLLNRKISYLPLLNAANRPAINQGDVFMNQNLFTTNGAGRRQTTFVVDGGTDNDSWGRQTTFSTLPLDSLQEMGVLTNAFSAEFGGSTGSVINIVTKGGGSQLHGSLMELWRPAGTEAALSGFTSANAASGNDWTNDTLGQSAVSLSNTVYLLTGLK